MVVCVGADAGGSGNALEVVMGIWIERQLEFVGSYRINLATTALVQLLACRHPALMALQVLPTHPPPPPLAMQPPAHPLLLLAYGQLGNKDTSLAVTAVLCLLTWPCLSNTMWPDKWPVWPDKRIRILRSCCLLTLSHC